MERKERGQPRYCKWCLKYKPDRCHHCRSCKTCVLRMDHHCPWIMNCIGSRNHKYFFLLLFYATVNCVYTIVTQVPTVQASMTMDMPSERRFLLVLSPVVA